MKHRRILNRCFHVGLLILVAHERGEHVRINLKWLRDAMDGSGLN